jgi:hypothetical protein
LSDKRITAIFAVNFTNCTAKIAVIHNMNILPTETPEIIITEDLQALGVQSEEALAKFARVANGLINNDVY